MDIRFELQDNIYIRIDTNEFEYIKGVDEHLTAYVKGYMHMPKFKAGHWSGKVSKFKRQNRTFPYGLLLKVLKYTKKEWSDLTYEVSDQVKSLFKGYDITNADYNLTYKPYNYQKLAIETAISRSKGICQLPTASGKSLVITYIITHISKHISNEQSLIIVPTLQLIDQFKDDMIEYGINKDDIGCVNSKSKEFDKKIVVSTWQSMKNNHDQLWRYYTVIIDEVHSAKADKLLEILGHCDNARFRIGMTGTMPTDTLENMNVRSLLGPVLIKYTGKDLANMGYISHCTVKMIKVIYENDLNERQNDYTFVRDEVFPNPYRLGLIKHIVKKTKNSILILIEKIEKEGELLEEVLSEAFPNKKVLFLSGRDKASVRDEARKEMNITDRKRITLVFGNIEISLWDDDDVLLSDKTSKLAKYITTNDDIDDIWIRKMSEK